MKYNIPVENIALLDKKMARIQRKAERNGTPFKYEKCETIHVEDEERPGVYHDVIVVDVDCIVKRNGWEVVAVLDHEYNRFLNCEGENLVHKINDGPEIPKRFYGAKCNCEHCNINRYRKETVVLYNEEKDIYRQVGKSCLMEYTNGINADMVADAMTFINEVENFTEYGTYSTLSVRVDEFLLNVYVCAQIWGYQTKKAIENRYNEMGEKRFAAMDYPHKSSTAGMAISVTSGDAPVVNRSEFWEYHKEHYAEAGKFVADARKWISEQDTSDNDFMNNMRVLSQANYVRVSDIGTLAYLIKAYDNVVKTLEKKEKEKEKVPQYIYGGEVNERIEIQGVLVPKASFETMYGTMNIYNIEVGNVLYVWKTTTFVSDCFVNQVVNIRGTVKEHKEYKGIRQTVLTRCKIIG